MLVKTDKEATLYSLYFCLSLYFQSFAFNNSLDMAFSLLDVHTEQFFFSSKKYLIIMNIKIESVQTNEKKKRME